MKANSVLVTGLQRRFPYYSCLLAAPRAVEHLYKTKLNTEKSQDFREESNPAKLWCSVRVDFKWNLEE